MVSLIGTKMTTFVSFFFDLGRSSPYYEWIEKLLELNINLIFYTTEPIHSKLTYTPRKNLIFVLGEREIDSVLLTKFKRSWKNYTTGNKAKDTHEFGYLTHSKFDYLLKAMAFNPFSTEYFGWVDAGLVKVADQLELIEKIEPHEQVSLLTLKEVVNTDRKGFVLSPKEMVAAGLLVGSKDHLTKVCELMVKERTKKDLGLEQEHLAMVYENDPSLFFTYHGTYHDIVTGLLRSQYVLLVTCHIQGRCKGG